jgi:hypothetical protein
MGRPKHKAKTLNQSSTTGGECRTRVDTSIDWLKNHRFASVAVLLGMFVIAIGALANALTDIGTLFVVASPDVIEARGNSEPITAATDSKTHWVYLEYDG